MTPEPSRPVRPKPAASLVLIDGAERVLMGRRPPRSRFAPDAWVFPGGRVDRTDPGTGDARFRAAAVRETAEETGLVVEQGLLRPLGRAITPSESPIRFDARFYLARAAESLSGASLVSNGEFTEIAWLPIDQALRLPLMDVTEVMLTEAAARLWSGGSGCLVLTYRRGVVYLRRTAAA